jgi:clan AA aspartic protease (TIGR02281 family)
MFRQTRAAVTAASIALAVSSGSVLAAAAHPPAPTPVSIAMRQDGGVYVVPVSVNGVLTLDCIVDSGASDVNIPAEMFRKLVRAGSVKESDYAGTSDYTLADGSTERGRVFRIRSLKVGNVVVQNVLASIGGDGSSALLGQSFLGRFRSWSQDNTRHTLSLLGPVSPAPETRVAAHRPPPPGTVPDTTSVAQIRHGHGSSQDDSPAAISSQEQTPEAADSGLTAQDGGSH